MDSSPARTEFGAPFNFPDANLILLTSDNVIFRVHRSVLSLVSATIATFPFELSMDPADEHDDIPVFPMASETQQGIEHILRLIYPVQRPTWHTLAEVHVVLEIARKYQMDVVTQAATEVLTRDDFLKKQPLGVYTLSCAYGLHDVLKAKVENKILAVSFFSIMDCTRIMYNQVELKVLS